MTVARRVVSHITPRCRLVKRISFYADVVRFIAGRLGLGAEESTSYNKPMQITTLPEGVTPIDVVCGFNSSVILTAEGKIFCAGTNRYNFYV